MVPVVVAMRNEALKEHHWAQIETAIHADIERGENFTLDYLLALKVNDYKEEIEAVSTAATQEAVLEGMLAKVEGLWVRCIPALPGCADGGWWQDAYWRGPTKRLL